MTDHRQAKYGIHKATNRKKDEKNTDRNLFMKQFIDFNLEPVTKEFLEEL